MKKLFLILSIILLFHTNMYAGFPVGKGRTVLSLAYNYYHSNSNFDINGHIQKSKHGDYFDSHYLSLYVAHGISRKLDIFAAIPYVYEASRNDSIYLSRGSFADCLLGFSLTKMNKSFNKFTSFKLAGIWPLYHGVKPLAISYGATGVDFTINYTYTPKTMKTKGYFMLEGSYRHYFTTEGPDQFLFDIGRSFTINHFNYIICDLSGTISSSINKSTIVNPVLSKDFSYLEAKLTIGRRMNRTLTLYLEGFYTPIGRNTGVGLGGVFVSVWKLP